ncbi:MAG: hypothetical protein AB7O26_10860 [Planctomycetaceae bacterium]
MVQSETHRELSNVTPEELQSIEGGSFLIPGLYTLAKETAKAVSAPLDLKILGYTGPTK